MIPPGTKRYKFEIHRKCHFKTKRKRFLPARPGAMANRSRWGRSKVLFHLPIDLFSFTLSGLAAELGRSDSKYLMKWLRVREAFTRQRWRRRELRQVVVVTSLCHGINLSYRSRSRVTKWNPELFYFEIMFSKKGLVDWPNIEHPQTCQILMG